MKWEREREEEKGKQGVGVRGSWKRGRKVKLEEGGGVIDRVKWGKEEGKGGLGRVQYTGTHYT